MITISAMTTSLSKDDRCSVQHIIQTGMKYCYDENGMEVTCKNSGQDGALCSGLAWPVPRFSESGSLVKDHLTELIWSKSGMLSEYPLSWNEAFKLIEQMNQRRDFNRDDWRLPNRRELRSLIDHSAHNPALPDKHPFEDLYLGWYWTSTSAALAPSYAWYVHLEGGRMFYGRKTEFYWVWPVCGSSRILPRTGAKHCYDENGTIIACSNTKQDGDTRTGVRWPNERFSASADRVYDRLTGLTWYNGDMLEQGPCSWSEALTRVSRHSEEIGEDWRLPTINELESLVDASTHTPALPLNHPFNMQAVGYWSSTSSGYDTAWSYVLYLNKGAVGVGFKCNRDFFLCPVLAA